MSHTALSVFALSSHCDTSAHAIRSAPVGTNPQALMDDSALTARAGVGYAAIPTVAVTALLTACGGGAGGTNTGTGASTPSTPSTPSSTVGVVPNPNYLKPASNADAARFLLQAQLSASDADIATLKSVGYAAYLQSQFDAPLGQTMWAWLEQRGYGVGDANNYFFSFYPADFGLWNQLFTAPDSLRKRLALALSEFFVVSITGSEFTWRSHAIAQFWDTLVKGAFGNLRDVLEEVTLNPAMGYYLNTKGNLKEDPAKNRLPDENYAREVMQLFSIGIYQLNMNGTLKTDAAGKPLETYTPSDVANLAKVFTGYNFDTSDGVRLPVTGQTYTIESRDFTTKRMSLNTANHSTSAASFLGVTVPAGATAAQGLKIALDALFNHPNAAPFFCKQMIQRLVTSNPSAAYVGRVSAVFANNGKGVRGDLKAVWAALLQDDEARSPAGLASPSFGKLREPMLRLIQWGRTFGLKSAAGSWKIFDLSNAATQLGQSPLRSPSVFNFFRPGFVPPSTPLATSNTPAPEFQLVNESSVGGYLNYLQDIIRNGINCPEPTVPQAAYTNYSRDVTASYTEELALVNDAAGLVARLNLLLCAGQLSAATQTVVVNALNATPLSAASTAAQKLDRVAAAVFLVMASAEYLVQK
jgi:uncharacterized protein (DUF1800 family)